jgi:hypothetical protein
MGYGMTDVIQLALSLLSSSALLYARFSSGRASVSPMMAFGNATALGLASWHMGAFWNKKEQTRIPFMTEFNEAVRGSEKVVSCLRMAGMAWGVLGAVWWWGA